MFDEWKYFDSFVHFIIWDIILINKKIGINIYLIINLKLKYVHLYIFMYLSLEKEIVKLRKICIYILSYRKVSLSSVWQLTIFSTGRDSSNGGSKVLRINRSFIQNLITIKLINYFNLNLCLTTIKKIEKEIQSLKILLDIQYEEKFAINN